MGSNESSSGGGGSESSVSGESGCRHGFNDDLRFDHRAGDTLETTHAKNEFNAAADRAESFESSGHGALDSAVQSFLDGHTLQSTPDTIAQGCGECHGENCGGGENSGNSDSSGGGENK